MEARVEVSIVWRVSEAQGGHSGFCGQHQRSIHPLLRRNKEDWYLGNVGNQLNQHQIRPEVGKMLKTLRELLGRL